MKAIGLFMIIERKVLPDIHFSNFFSSHAFLKGRNIKISLSARIISPEQKSWHKSQGDNGDSEYVVEIFCLSERERERERSSKTT
jgi:hypothetical protein